MTKAAALDYAGKNIRLNAALPGTMWSSLVKGDEGIFRKTTSRRSHTAG